MSKNIIMDYVQQIIRDNSIPNETPGPVITISREFGCPGSSFAETLSSSLSQRKTQNGKKNSWAAINKEVISEAAKDLNLPEDLIQKIYSTRHSSNPFENLFMSFSDFYLPSDIEIKKKIANIMLTMANRGNVILVGRGGAIITRDIPDSFHIQLYAPISWRVEQTMRQKPDLSKEEAHKMVEMVDRERIYIRNFFAGESSSGDFFDIRFNLERLSLDDVMQACLFFLEHKGIIQPK